MVMGIFMCCIVVGTMWYVAGIGDALVLRERSQEIADAGAFSGAALHARGMNLIVLLNLVMACILGIRVALKALQLVLVILGVLFAAIGWIVPGVGVLAGPCLNGAKLLNNVIKRLDPSIDKALKAMSKAELGISKVVPAAACAGAMQVQLKYKPLAKVGLTATAVNLPTAKFLPVKEGTADRLCYEAGKSVGVLIGWGLGKVGLDGLSGGAGGGYLSDKFGKVAKAGGSYFCGMGSGKGKPNFDDLFGDTAKDSCDSKYKQKVDELDKARAGWLAKCTEYKVTCTEGDELRGFGDEVSFMDQEQLAKATPAQRSELTGLQQTRDAKKSAVDSFDNDQCKKEEMKKLKDGAAENIDSSSSSSGEDMTPKMVLPVSQKAGDPPGWYNGVPDYQLIAVGVTETDMLARGARGVRVGAINMKTKDSDIPTLAGYSLAQSEFFFDCKGGWKSPDCNGNYELNDGEGAMWHFRWRGRLRRYNSPHKVAQVVAAPVAGALAEAAADMGGALAKHITGPGNAAKMRPALISAMATTKPENVILH